MEGISQEAIALAGHLQAQQADRAVRRQRHLDRRPAVAVRLGRPDQALRGRGWAATRVDGHDPAAIAAAIAKAQNVRPAVADRLPDHHRLRRADQGRHRKSRTARRSAPTRSRARARSSAGPYAAVRDSRRHPRPPGARPGSAAGRRAPPGTSASPRSMPRQRAEFERRMRRRSAQAGARRRRARGEGEARRHAEGNRHPHGLANSRSRA